MGGETHLEREIDRILVDIVRPTDYVGWEYISRQRLLAIRVAAFRGSRATRVLDIGCGHGALALTLVECTGMNVVAMDIVPDRVVTVRSKERARGAPDGPIRLLVGNAHSLPFRGETFEAVVATEVLEHLDGPERALREVRRVLRPGGRVFMTTPNSGALPYRILPYLPHAVVRKLAASLTRTHLHPELLQSHDALTSDAHPDRHRREGFGLRELEELGKRCGLYLLAGHTYRIPVPDRVMLVLPRPLSPTLARLGAKPLPLGLQVYAEFAKP